MQVSSKVTAAFDEATRALPGVTVTVESFVAWLEQGAVQLDELEARSVDLLLAHACARGDRCAIQHFESLYLSRVPTFSRSVKLGPGALEELTQRARVKLLVGNPPGIATYRGRAPLRAWVRVCVVRLALDLAADSQRSGETDLLDAVTALQDTPEIAAARDLYRDRLQRAVEAAVQRLEPRQKTILRMNAVDGLNVDAIGAVYGVHRATVARWLVTIRAEIFQSLRADLGLNRPASPSEVRSLIALLRDQIHLSASQVFAAQP